MKTNNAIPLRFSGSTNEYFRIWFVNLLLSILTLGIYSAWAKVRSQQYLYRHTWFEETSFDYHAEALRILRGRILFAVLLAATVAVQYFVTWSVLIVAAIGFVATPWVLVSVLRFKAKNSSYKNIRFSFHGTTADSYKTMIVGGLVYALTLGLGIFYWQYKLYDFIGKNHRFGDLEFRFTPKAGDFFFIYLLSVLIYFVMATLLVAAMVTMAALFEGESQEFLIVIFLYGTAFIVEAFFKAKVTNLIWSGIVIGNHRVLSTQTFLGVLWLQLINLAGIVVSLGLLIPWAKIRSVRYRIEHLAFLPQGEVLANAGEVQQSSALGEAIDDLGDFDLDFL